MKAYILSVGDEVLSGRVVNTNASFLAIELEKLGIDVIKVITIGDDKNRIIEALNEFELSDANIIISTGGLGPTHDDFTKEVICEHLNVKLSYNDIAALDMYNYFQTVKNDCNVKQVYFPEDCIIINNKLGSADGFILEKGKKTYIVLVGPPFEMKPMFLDQVKTFLETKGSKKNIIEYIAMGNSESFFENLLKDLIKKDEFVNIAPYCSNGKIRYQLTADSKHLENLNTIAKQFEKIMGDYLVSKNNENIEVVLINKLKEKNLHISFCESCTGGLLASTIISIAGASEVISESLITYSNDAKNKYLNVSFDTINKYDVVSKEVVNEMQEGLFKLTNSEVCVAVSGYAGPTGASIGKICFAIRVNDNVYLEEKHFKGNRNMILERAMRYILYKTYLLIK